MIQYVCTQEENRKQAKRKIKKMKKCLTFSLEYATIVNVRKIKPYRKQKPNSPAKDRKRGAYT